MQVDQLTGQIASLSTSAAEAATGQPRPWGVGATLAWTLLALVTGMVAATAVASGLSWWDRTLFDPQFLFRYGDPVSSSMLILGYGVLVGVLALAAKWAGWSVAEYLALVRPRGHYVLFGLASVALPLLVTFMHAMQFDISQLVNPHGFDRARAANGLWLHVIAVAIAAPVMEEIVFRGFLYRGLAESRIGVMGAIAVTSVGWALLHFGMGAAGMIDTVVAGVAWGWLRWYTGSTTAAIVWHVANNGFVSLLILANLYGWLSWVG
jgi:membrane protease YdiL (CAAX protease family)